MGISALLAVPEYRGAVLEGLVASIGGLDASLSKDATAAFVQTLTTAGPGGLASMSAPLHQFSHWLMVAVHQMEMV